VPNPKGRFRWVQPPIFACIRGVLWQDFAKRNTSRLARLLTQLLEIRSYESTDQSGCDVIGMAFDHQCKVEKTLGGEVEVPKGIAQEHTCDDGGA
jgi:hypothetical protein